MRFLKALVTTAFLATALTSTAYAVTQATATATDNTAVVSTQLGKQKPAKERTLADTIKRNTAAKDLAECGTSPCPPKLRYIGPTTISTYIDGKFDSFKADVKECDRIAPGKEYCLYPEDKFSVDVPKLTAAQKKAGYKVGLWSKDPTLWNKQGTGIFNDYVVTHTEAKDGIDTKDKLFVVLRDANGKLCASYGLDYKLDACVHEAPIPTPVAPKPYCGDGIVNVPGEQCDGQDGLKPGQVCLPDCTIECPPEDVFKEVPTPIPAPVPQVYIPPIVPEQPSNWNAGLFMGASESAFEKTIRTQNEYCPGACNEKGINNLFTGPSLRLEAGYGRPDLTADFTVTHANTEDKQDEFGASQFKQYFATERSVTDLNLDLTKTWFNDSRIKVAANAEGSYARIETGRNDITDTKNAAELLGGIGLSIGDLNKTHATVTAGYAQKDVVYDTFIPGFMPNDPGMLTVETPVIKTDLQLSLDGPRFFGKNTFDLYGIGKHFLPQTVDNVEVKTLQEIDAGINWMFDLGNVKVGPAIRYNQQNHELNFGNASVQHPTGDTTQYWGGVRISW